MPRTPAPPRRILETALYCDDLEAAERFYQDVLGLQRVRVEDGRHVFFRVGEAMLLLFNPEATRHPPLPDAPLPVPAHGARGPGHACFAATREELDLWAARLRAHGVAIEADFEWPADTGRSIYFRDPAGNSLEFATPSIWGL